MFPFEVRFDIIFGNFFFFRVFGFEMKSFQFHFDRMGVTWTASMISKDALAWKWSLEKGTGFCFILYLQTVQSIRLVFPFVSHQHHFSNHRSEILLHSNYQGINQPHMPLAFDSLIFFNRFHKRSHLLDAILQTSLHGSCPVIKGQKWVATKWIRDQEQEDWKACKTIVVLNIIR